MALYLAVDLGTTGCRSILFNERLNLVSSSYVEYGLYLKAMAGFGTVIINELSGGVLPGYLYTPESLVMGGYETDTSMIDVSFGPKLMQAALDTVARVK